MAKLNRRTYQIALVFYLLLIFILSSIPGDDFPKVDFEFSDKIVHIIIYSILFLLFFYSLKNQSKYTKLQKYAPEFSFLFTALYGITDELHQYFVPKRSCDFYDWFADLTGALLMYMVIKFYYSGKKTMTVALLLAVLSGCSTSEKKFDKSEDIKVTITKEDAWLNLMPGIGENKNNFGFLISLTVNTATPKANYSIKDLRIFLNNDTITGKTFSTANFETGKDEININISHLITEKYLSNDKPLPDEVQFDFSIYKDNTKIKTIQTSKLKLNRVY